MKESMKSRICPHPLPFFQRERRVICREKRRGVILILILACLAIAGMLLIAGVRLALSSHHVARQSN